MENFKSLAQKMIILLRKMWFFQFRPRSDFSLYIYEKRRISRKPFEIFTWNFKNLLVLVVSTNSAKMNNICDGGCHFSKKLADLTWNDPIHCLTSTHSGCQEVTGTLSLPSLASVPAPRLEEAVSWLSATSPGTSTFMGTLQITAAKGKRSNIDGFVIKR